MTIFQIKPVRGQFVAVRYTTFKIVPIDLEIDSPLTH